MGTRSYRDVRTASPRYDPRLDGRRKRARPNRLARLLLAFCVVVGLAAMSFTVSMLLAPGTPPPGVHVVGQAAAGVTAVPTGTSGTADDVASAVCHIPPAQPGMLTPYQIEHPMQVGTRIQGNGQVASCVHFGLSIPDPAAGNPNLPGQVILVSLTQQWLWAYQDGALVFATPVTTGMPNLWTPQGTFPISVKRTDQMFYSPWPPGSPYYYTPEHINYEMLFREKGFYIHDAPWRHDFGPDTEVPHTNPDGTQETGSHGCVEVVTPAAAWLYNWAAIGATVDIVA